MQHYRYNQKNQLVRAWGERITQGVHPDGMPDDPPHHYDMQFAYDALGRRIEKRDSTRHMRYYYDRLNIIALCITPVAQTVEGATDTQDTGHTDNHNDTQDTQWVYFTYDDTTDTPLSLHNQHGTFYYHRNHQGSIMALSDRAGHIVERFTYDCWGRVLSHTTQQDTDNPYAFTGREYDLPDLYYYRARYYDPTLARFLSPDPIELLSRSGQCLYLHRR